MNGTAPFFVDGVYYQPGLMEYSPSMNITAPMLGSTYYVESLSTSDPSNIRAYLNFGMIASPNYIYAIYDGDGSAEIEHFFEAWFADNGLNSTAMGDRTTRPSSATASRLAALSLAPRRSRRRRRRCPGARRGSRRMSTTIKPVIRLRIRT